MVEAYRDERRQQPSKRKPNQTVKGATVNRELECLKCMLDFATKRRYIAENPASAVKHFNELRERPTRRMLTLEEERRILDAAPVYLRVAIILLSAEPIPLSEYACDVLQAWRKEAALTSKYVFPSPVLPNRPDLNGKNRLENNFETSWRDSVSDLHFTSRLLHSSK